MKFLLFAGFDWTERNQWAPLLGLAMLPALIAALKLAGVL